jgi:hypothetical protein
VLVNEAMGMPLCHGRGLKVQGEVANIKPFGQQVFDVPLMFLRIHETL